MNATLTKNLIDLKGKLKKIETENEMMTTQLFAQRLENAKLKEEIKEIKIQMKRQYELSIENTRKELEDQIRANKTNSWEESERQAAYLKMRQLEHKYEQISSETVTVNELLKSAYKIHRYYE